MTDRICKVCKETILKERIEALPDATMCIKCQKEFEDRKKKDKELALAYELASKSPIGKNCPSCGGGLVVRLNKARWNLFLGCRRYPACTYTEKVENIRRCPECDKQLKIKSSNMGYFFGCPNFPECKYTEKVI